MDRALGCGSGRESGQLGSNGDGLGAGSRRGVSWGLGAGSCRFGSGGASGNVSGICDSKVSEGFLPFYREEA
jgi:hypothetical protein